MLRRELPIWVTALVVAVVLLIVGVIYWRLSRPPETSQPPIRVPGVPITAQPPSGPGASPMPATARPGSPPSTPIAPSPPSGK